MSHCYDTTSKPGFAIIISIANVEGHIPLQAYNVGGDRAESMFHSVGYEVKRYENLTKAQIHDVVNEFSSGDKLQNYSNLVVFFLSYGTNVNGHVVELLGSKAKVVDVDAEVVRPFAESKALAGKPKVFVLGAVTGVSSVRGTTQPARAYDDTAVVSLSVKGVQWAKSMLGSFLVRGFLDALRDWGGKHDLTYVVTALKEATVGARNSKDAEGENYATVHVRSGLHHPFCFAKKDFGGGQALKALREPFLEVVANAMRVADHAAEQRGLSCDAAFDLRRKVHEALWDEYLALRQSAKDAGVTDSANLDKVHGLFEPVRHRAEAAVNAIVNG